jgi:hypothetical protein
MQPGTEHAGPISSLTLHQTAQVAGSTGSTQAGCQSNDSFNAAIAQVITERMGNNLFIFPPLSEVRGRWPHG